MKSSRARGAVSLPLIIIAIVAGALIFSALFYSFWQKLNRKVETTLKDQFNQQQLMLARKIADNVESYFDFLENALMGYAGLFQTTPPDGAGDRRFPGRKVLPAQAVRPPEDHPVQFCRYRGAGFQHLYHAYSGRHPEASRRLFEVGPGPPAPRPPVLDQNLRLPRGPLAGPESDAVHDPPLLGEDPPVRRGPGISH